ncbi:copper amine oxidase [Halobacillus sp. ACCC02827]|uniref:copper amine oxidase n=1 Tax=Halobacillus sp. ACCC02827 TaxID=3052090 RepID=UPI002570D2DE|nr:copper amine oxidase [Halobacillus sp. ACCC02827]WJE16301.1 copper amine oxidase [Halobacillus sp. ACCC02827]
MKHLKKIMIMMLALVLLVPSLAMASNSPTVKTPAADLRSTLDQLLSEHFVLATTYMMKSYDDAPDAEQVWEKLDQNAADMTPAIASVYGEEAAAQFEEIFRGHNDYSDAFVEAAKNDDADAREMAEAEVDEFVNEFGSFLAAATDGNLPEDAAKEALKAHEQDVVNVFDHYVNGDYQEAYTAFRKGFQRMFTVSEALSTAIVTQMPDQFEGTKADTKAADLRSNLNALAAEHFALAVLEMQKGYDQAEDYDFVTWAENEHTKDFTAAIASIYGEDGAAQFEQVWQQDHINAQADVVSAVLEGDEEAKQMAEDSLQLFAKDFGAFLDAATEGNLPADAATEAVWSHEEDVLQTFESYAGEDYEAAYDSFREGYAFMFGIGETLGDAIVMQMPEQFGTEMPDAMPDTGLGGMSDQGQYIWMWIAFGVLAAAGAGFVYRKKATE